MGSCTRWFVYFLRGGSLMRSWVSSTSPSNNQPYSRARGHPLIPTCRQTARRISLGPAKGHHRCSPRFNYSCSYDKYNLSYLAVSASRLLERIFPGHQRTDQLLPRWSLRYLGADRRTCPLEDCLHSNQ